MKFNYQARTKTGQVYSGEIEAFSREGALQVLKSYGLYVTSLEEIKPSFFILRLKFLEKVPKKEVVAFSRQLAIMFKSEIPPVEALETVARQTHHLLLKRKIFEMIDKIEGGVSVSKTFADFPEVFSNFYISMVRSGETVGKLSETFSYLADYLEKEYEFKRKVIGALTYPTFLSVVFVIVVGIIIFFVIPNLMEFLKDSGVQLPFLTKFLINTVNFVKSWFFLFMLVILGSIFGLYTYYHTKEGKSLLDKKILNLPFIGDFLKSIYISRVALNISTLLAGGISVIQSLEIIKEVIGNEVYRQIISETIEKVKKGERISSSFAKYPDYFSPIFIQMLVVGEKTGKLDYSLKNIVSFYENEVQRELNGLMQLLEPLLITFFGILVGGLMASVIIPIYQIMMNVTGS